MVVKAIEILEDQKVELLLYQLFFFFVAVIKHIVVICFLRPYHITASFRMKKVSYEILLRLKACLPGRLTAFSLPPHPFFRGEKGAFELQRKY